MSYRLIPVDLPRWEQVREGIEAALDVRADEIPTFVGINYLVHLPTAVHEDCLRLASQVKWSPGQLLGYLVLQGALRLAERDDGR